jgi:hypothetical protein
MPPGRDQLLANEHGQMKMFREMQQDPLRRHKVAWACVVTLFLSACRGQPYSGPLADYVRRAKQEHRTSTSFGELYEPTYESLRDLLTKYSLVVVTPLRVNAAQTVANAGIQSWTVFRLVEVVVNRPTSAERCRWPLPSSLSLKSGELAFVRSGGSTTIDGVTITMNTNAFLPEDSTRNYLVVAVTCPNGVAYSALPISEESVFEITPQGRIVSGPGTRFPSQIEMQALGTLDRVKNYVASLPTEGQ